MRFLLANLLFVCFLLSGLRAEPEEERTALLDRDGVHEKEEEAALGDGGADEGNKEDAEAGDPVRGVSLAFVFDSTGSMNDELNQVKVGASKILAALRDHPDAPIYNYIWVPFKDPDIGPVTVTTDEKVFRERVQDVVVFGGGDCPEMSIGAIKKALEASLPNSYIYVFTDASAKDHRLQNEVLSMVQRKQSQVVFILTGDCGDLEEPNYKAYERIAESSSGQIYRLSRKEVKEVLEYVNVAIQPHVVSLVSLNKPAPDPDNPDRLEVLIDESLTQFTVSVSGANATLNVTDPKGVSVDGPPKLENVLTLKNIKIVNVKEPDPGAWSVFINSDSNYTVRSTGLSKVNFNHGFSTGETLNLKETNYRPLKGAKSFILIQTSDSEKVFNITDVDFVSLGGDVLQHVPLLPVSGKSGLYKGGSFVPPEEFFYLGVMGFGRDGLPVRRITSTAVSAQLPERPIIHMRASAVGRISESVSVKCHVESAVPFLVRWHKDGSLVGEEKNCSETCEVVLTIDRLTLHSEGSYSCSAKNVAGFDSKSLTLSVTGDAPSVFVKSPVVVSLGDTAFLDCFVDSKIPHVVKWTQFTAKSQHAGVLHPVSTGRKLSNHTLVIEKVKAEDEGWYVCKAKNRGGQGQGRVLLVVKEPLSVKVAPSLLKYVEGDSVRLTCSASGKPQPKVEWARDHQPIRNEDPSFLVEEVNGNLHLVIDYVEKRNAGVYFCNAMNSEGTATATAELVYTEKPRVKANENNVMVKTSAEVILRCNASGDPEPKLSWHKGEMEVDVVGEERLEIQEGALIIHSAHSSDAGEYSCVAQNEVGSDVDYIGLMVGSPPTFLQKPRDKKIQTGHNGTVACSAIGVPPPETTWRRVSGQLLDASRMTTLPSGALRITRTRPEDAGPYLCTAENVFGSVSNEVSIVVTGIEKPLPDKNVELRKVEAASGSDLAIPCGVLLGNPPGRVVWLKNGVNLTQDERIVVESSGSLLIRNATPSDRGNYECWAQNAAGNASRPYEIFVSESPRMKESNGTGLKAKVGGEIVIPCAVEGFPVPTVTWTRNGLPLPASSTIFQNSEGSLIIRNLSEDNTGVYVCTAINTVGSASKATSIYVQVPPLFPIDVQDSPVNIVEGHVVVLDCNVSAVPDPSVSWFKNGEPLLQNSDQPKTLRFVANMDDTGVFKCVVENEAGSAFKEFNVTILVPPKILGRSSEESIKAKAGAPIALLCNVFGVPPPAILWQRNGMYLTQNTSEVAISPSGTLTIHNVTKESAGAYTCDAENLGGITQRVFYLQVNYPPKILEESNTSKVITLKEGEEYSLSCVAEGNPKPNVIWRKNGLPILGQEHDVVVLEDNTLVFVQVSRETNGVYKCEALSSEGSAATEHEIQVLVPPSLTSESYPTRIDVNEGDSLSLKCPIAFSEPPSHIQWFKEGEPLVFLQERADEAQMKLSPDQAILTLMETHPADGGNYSCAATNPAGRTDAQFSVDVLMTPHFEEFNHIAHRTILTGGEVVLNCSVSGNPRPKISWRKESVPVTPHNTPGVYVSMDKRHLIIANGKVHHSGTYVCAATNRVSTKEREFYVTVLDPPQIAGNLKEEVDVVEGDNVTLECEANGVPAPTFTWAKEDEARKILNGSESHLHISHVSCADGGKYFCDVTNVAGTRTKHFQLNVFQKPRIDHQDRVENITAVFGHNVTLRCKAAGVPRPEITWLHNGHVLSKTKRSALNMADGDVSLTLTDVREKDRGTYTLLASNRAGVGEKQFNVRVLVPPTLGEGVGGTRSLQVIHPFPIVLKCPAQGEPPPSVVWFYGGVEGARVGEGDEFRVEGSKAEYSGVYVCVAENLVGRVTHYFNVSVVEPPRVKDNQEKKLNFVVNETIVLYCNLTGDEDLKHTWFHSSHLLQNSSDNVITDSGRILVVPRAQPKDAGRYTCLLANAAGSAEVSYRVLIHEPPTPIDGSSTQQRRTVRLSHPLSLFCSLNGYPAPEITWTKDGLPFVPLSSGKTFVSDNSLLSFDGIEADDAGEYKCVARNSAGTGEMSFTVNIEGSAEWGEWSSWSECSVSCGLGERRRGRSCALVEPGVKVERGSCEGSDLELQKCYRECQIIGGWSSWSSWSSCSRSCGRGVRRRFRICENAKHAGSGKECAGEESAEEVCTGRECGEAGQWSAWSEWSECSDSCGGGVTQRVRRCDSDNCEGRSSEINTCNRQKCPGRGRWSPWSEWSPCSASCGRGQKTRTRACLTPGDESQCRGDDLQVKQCLATAGICHDPLTAFTQLDAGEGSKEAERDDLSVEVEVIGALERERPHSYLLVQGREGREEDGGRYAVRERERREKKRKKEDEAEGEGYRCSLGFFYDAKHNLCEDINECETPDACAATETCENTFGSYVCICRRGLRRTEGGCADVDECTKGLDLCSHSCHNTFGSYSCSCPAGLRLAHDGKTCYKADLASRRRSFNHGRPSQTDRNRVPREVIQRRLRAAEGG